MEESVVAGVETHVESGSPGISLEGSALQLQILGPVTVRRNGKPVPLPQSRKVRALIAYLAVAAHAVTRPQLCELLWEIPSDPRGELRWCLSKVRSVLDEPARRRVDARADLVALDLSDCFVDAVAIDRAGQQGFETSTPDQLRALLTLCTGDFLEGLEIEHSPAFGVWLSAQRQRFRARHTAILEQLAGRVPDDEASEHLCRWIALAPFDHRAHEALLKALARRGRIREGDEHLAASAPLFEAEGLDFAPIRALWKTARADADMSTRVGVVVVPPSDRTDRPIAEPTTARRASIAVMPFENKSAAEDHADRSAGGLTYDVITRLAKLRSLFVIAQGTVFALHERHVGPEEAGQMLNVDYVVSGAFQRIGTRLRVTVELVDTRTARIVWNEVFDQELDDAFLVLDEIGNRIVSSVASEIETNERNRAILRPPTSLDAWEAHHRGLWHMYRFNRADNAQAQHFFAAAVRMDPTFARAYAGLSFTHWQSAFQGWSDREAEVAQAFEAAGQSVLADDRDPAAHWAMGRALWLRGQQDQCLVELDQAVELSPNFALGHYTLAFVHAQSGDPQAAIRSADTSRHLSPFDPLLFGMLGARAMALLRLQQYDEAADWAIKAAARPNAHAHILGIAAYSLALAGRVKEGRGYMATIRKTVPAYDIDAFLEAFHFAPDMVAQLRAGARRIGA